MTLSLRVVIQSCCPSYLALARVAFLQLYKVATWLILPVVICLSQRLSHACLSISNYTVKLRMAHYISYRLFDSTLLHGIPVVILELIHAKNLDFGRGVFIR